MSGFWFDLNLYFSQAVSFITTQCLNAFSSTQGIFLWDFIMRVKVLVAQSCPTLCDPMDCSPPDSSVHGILEAGVLEWVAIPISRVSSWPRDWARVSCIAGGFFTIWATRETHHSATFTPHPHLPSPWTWTWNYLVASYMFSKSLFRKLALFYQRILAQKYLWICPLGPSWNVCFHWEFMYVNRVYIFCGNGILRDCCFIIFRILRKKPAGASNWI